MSAFNKWFCSLPEGRQKALRDDKWALANAAFEHATAERDAALAREDELVAKIDAIKDAWMAAGSWPDTVEGKQVIANAINAAPAQHLRDIQAEAVMSFVSFVYQQFEKGDYHRIARGKHHQLNSRAQGQTVSIHNDAEYCGILGNAEFYADRVKAGDA